MKRNILVNAGSTLVPIDQVRGITNIFSGRTGSNIADYFSAQGDNVTLVSSNLTFVKDTAVEVKKFKTFDDLARVMEAEVRTGKYDVIIHSAAISDYKVEVVYPKSASVLERDGKIASTHDRLVMELVQTPKLIDFIRRDWGFKGTLVKFKLEVGLCDEDLIKKAKKSMEDSDADLMVANCLEWSAQYAYIIDKVGGCEKVSRRALAEEIYRRLS